MRPLWERAFCWAVADHLRAFGVGSDAAAYSAAALVVRDLDRRYNLTSMFAAAPITSAADIGDSDKVPERAMVILRAFWLLVRGADVASGQDRSSNPKRTELNRLVLLAGASLRAGGYAELAAAKQIAAEAKTVEADRGKLGASWLTGDSGAWNGLAGSHRRALMPANYEAGLDGLRDDVLAEAGDKAAAAKYYDDLVANATVQKSLVKAFQTWCKASPRRWYTGVLDGLWGDKTEAAWLHMAPGSARFTTSIDDVEVVLAAIAATGSAIQSADVITIGIARDAWLAAKKGILPIPSPDLDSAVTDAEQAAGHDALIVSVPEKPVPGSIEVGVDSAGHPLIVDSPKPPVNVVDAPPQAAGWKPTTGQIVAGTMVLVGVGLAAVAVKVSKSKRRVRALAPARARRR